MAQLNLYVPDEVAEQLKREAQGQGKSLSKYVLEKYLHPKPVRMAMDDEFMAVLKALGPLSDDFTVEEEEPDTTEPTWSFDDIPD